MNGQKDLLACLVLDWSAQNTHVRARVFDVSAPVTFERSPVEPELQHAIFAPARHPRASAHRAGWPAVERIFTRRRSSSRSDSA